MLAVKPDGTQLFMAWYDRRNDSNNSLIDVYGRWATIATDGTVTFGIEFKITSSSFPPVFAGTLPENLQDHHYDPVYPPEGVSLSWYWPSWPSDNVTRDAYRAHVGEYEGVWADEQYVYLTWTDNRLLSENTDPYTINQRDIRYVRITWP